MICIIFSFFVTEFSFIYCSTKILEKPENIFSASLEKCKNISSVCSTDLKVMKWNSNICDCFESIFQHLQKEGLRQLDEVYKPRMLCRTPSRLTFQWKKEKNGTFDVVFFQEYEGPWKFLTITSNSLLTIENLQYLSKYRIRIQEISINGLISSDLTGDWTSTLEENFIPGEINEISITSWHPKIGSLDAILSWKPSSERLCSYDLVCHRNLDYFTRIIKKPEELYSTKLSDLSYDTNYSVAICGTYEKEGIRIEGKKIWKVITTPSCLFLNNNSLLTCPPEKIKNLQLEEELIYIRENSAFYNVKIFWQAPKPVPDFIDLLLEKLPLQNPQNRNNYQTKIVGNETGYVFEDVDLGNYYRVRVWASSSGGSSPVAEQYRQLKHESDKYSELPTNSNWRIYVTAPILGTAVILSVILLIYYRIKISFKKKILQNEERINFEKTRKISYGKQNSIKSTDGFEGFVPDEYEIPYENLLFEEILGEGAFGVVRKGILKKNMEIQEVAVKMLREKPTSNELQQFRQEINLLKSLGKHPHIVSLIGCCTRNSSQTLLIVEYCQYGDLRNYLQQIHKEMTSVKKIKIAQEKSLHNYENFNRNIAINKLYDLDCCKEKSNILTAVDLLSFARQIAIGMEFLASNRVVHRDIAARNVLICKDKTVKISDFGLSRDVYERNFYLKGGDGKVPIKWMAMESLIYQKYTTQSDVWSFGVLLWEIVTFGAVPYPGIPSTRIVQLLTSGYRMCKPSNCSQELYDVMLSCWHSKPSERPTFSSLKNQLETILENSSSFQYINLEQSSFDSVTMTP